MSVSITVPAQYGFVIAAVASTAWLGLWQGWSVGRARKAAGIAYPQAYAEQAVAEKSEAAFRFNCAQRAHSNTLEIIPYVITMGLIWGLKQPVYSAAALEVWVLARIWYTRGYIKNGPKGRMASMRPGFLSMFVLFGGGSWAAYKFVVDSL
ncbi:membrane-associated proteins in eicosanoid and glutathione metabolism [Thelephora terrestris]|uniref:Membrane-associated proteins in eicosanoid and glutathione metabolism n=1 Tax=Thelephora terrestris TaxID=56493 RepID=A0A9P6L8G9_9AGAM|nr:membrane-associated proteins in eicosanoid and glutathione metabolism [Thelephora terrestris]